MDFSADPVAEAHRLAYGHLFNSAFAAETSLIDPLPHHRLAELRAEPDLIQAGEIEFLVHALVVPT